MSLVIFFKQAKRVYQKKNNFPLSKRSAKPLVNFFLSTEMSFIDKINIIHSPVDKIHFMRVKCTGSVMSLVTFFLNYQNKFTKKKKKKTFPFE